MNKKKKVLLITLQDNNNIGNRLQNFALQTALKQYDCLIDILIIITLLNHMKKHLSIIMPLHNGAKIAGTKEKIRAFLIKYKLYILPAMIEYISKKNKL